MKIWYEDTLEGELARDLALTYMQVSRKLQNIDIGEIKTVGIGGKVKHYPITTVKDEPLLILGTDVKAAMLFTIVDRQDSSIAWITKEGKLDPGWEGLQEEIGEKVYVCCGPQDTRWTYLSLTYIYLFTDHEIIPDDYEREVPDFIRYLDDYIRGEKDIRVLGIGDSMISKTCEDRVKAFCRLIDDYDKGKRRYLNRLAMEGYGYVNRVSQLQLSSGKLFGLPTLSVNYPFDDDIPFRDSMDQLCCAYHCDGVSWYYRFTGTFSETAVKVLEGLGATKDKRGRYTLKTDSIEGDTQ